MNMHLPEDSMTNAYVSEDFLTKVYVRKNRPGVWKNAGASRHLPHAAVSVARRLRASCRSVVPNPSVNQA